MKKHSHWTTGQLTKLRQHYPMMPWEFLLDEFYPHTKRSIETMASDLGIKRRGARRLAVAQAHRPTILFGGPRV